MTIHFNLAKVLDELVITKNALAVEAKIRPATVASFVNGEVSRIEIPTLISMLDALNRFAIEKGTERRYNIEDLITYEFKGAE
jgi:DNA-binding Xre family transcriptional regulator